MKYAVIQTSGRQYKVQEGDEIRLDKVDLQEGKKINFDQVLLFVDNDKVKLGQPYLQDVSVRGEVLSHFKGEKIRVATYKAKSRYRRVKGFRAQLTRVKIEKITPKKSKKD